MAGGERGAARRVEEHQPPAGPDDPGELAEPVDGVRQVHDEPRGEHGVEAAVRERQAARVGEHETAVALLAGLGEHLRRVVQPDDGPGQADGGAQRGQGAAGAAAGVEHDPARRQGRGLDRGGVRGQVVAELRVPGVGADAEERPGLRQVPPVVRQEPRGEVPDHRPLGVVQVDDDVRGIAPGAVGGVLPA